MDIFIPLKKQIDIWGNKLSPNKLPALLLRLTQEERYHSDV